MNCPKCFIPMKLHMVEDIEVDRCDLCNGVWLDKGEMETILAKKLGTQVDITEFNRDSLNIRLIYWYHPPNYWDFLAHGEKLSLEIKRRFAAEGIEFALPATTMHVTQAGDQPLRFRAVDEPAARETGDGP